QSDAQLVEAVGQVAEAAVEEVFLRLSRLGESAQQRRLAGAGQAEQDDVQPLGGWGGGGGSRRGGVPRGPVVARPNRFSEVATTYRQHTGSAAVPQFYCAVWGCVFFVKCRCGEPAASAAG